MSTKATTNKPKQDSWQAKGFVNLHLTEKQIEHAFSTFKDEAKVYAAWGNEMANGYRFTFSLDAKTGAIICSINCKDASSENYGWLLSSFSPSWFESLIISLYKHLVVLEAVWGNMETQPSSSKYG